MRGWKRGRGGGGGERNSILMVSFPPLDPAVPEPYAHCSRATVEPGNSPVRFGIPGAGKHRDSSHEVAQ